MGGKKRQSGQKTKGKVDSRREGSADWKELVECEKSNRRSYHEPDCHSRDSTLGSALLETCPRQSGGSFLSCLNTRTGCHRANSFSAPQLEDPELNSPFHRSWWFGDDSLLPSRAGAPHSQAACWFSGPCSTAQELRQVGSPTTGTITHIPISLRTSAIPQLNSNRDCSRKTQGL